MVGFSEEGSINDLLSDFERDYNEDSNVKANPDPMKRPLASYVTTLMVRGISSSLYYAFGHFASSSGLTGTQIYNVIWEGVCQLEAIGLKVMAVVADGASSNRKFMKIHQWEKQENVSSDGVVFWTWNECSPGTYLHYL